MRNLIAITVLAFFAFSCGEEGIGFNIGKEFPLDIPVDLPNGTPKFVEQVPGDPGPVTFSDTYSLENVDEFSEDLDQLEDIILKNLAFEISGVDASEQFELDSINITLKSEFGVTIAEIKVETPVLNNVAKTNIGDPAGLEALAQALDRKEDIESEVSFDFGEVPNEDINFDFTLYFDVVAKIRDL